MSRGAREAKNELFAQFARVAKALASAARLELVELLIQAPRTVEALARAAGLSVANASQHLKVLREAGLVATHKQGPYVTYRLADEAVEGLFVNLREVADARVAGLARARDAYLGSRDGMERIDADALRQRLRDDVATLVDVRPTDEFASAHLPGAISIPLATLDDRIDALPRDRQVVAYCRGPYCVYAVEAVARMADHGFKVQLYEGGVSGWRQRGLPVVAGDAK